MIIAIIIAIIITITVVAPPEGRAAQGAGLADDGKRTQTRRVARWTLLQARRDILSSGEVQEGRGSGLLLHSTLADDGKRAKTRRVARWTSVAQRDLFINWGVSEGGNVRCALSVGDLADDGKRV